MSAHRGQNASRGCRRAILAGTLALLLLGLATAAATVFVSVRYALVERHMALLENVAASREQMLRAVDAGWRERTALVANQRRLQTALGASTTGLASRATRRTVEAVIADAVAAMPEVVHLRVFDAAGRRLGASDARAPTTRRGALPVEAGVVGYRPRAGVAPTVILEAPIRHAQRIVGVVELALVATEVAGIAGDTTGLGATGETLVVRRLDANNAWVLAPPRHPPGTIFAVLGDDPVTATILAARGIAGSFREQPLVDYRGVPVLAAVEILASERLAIVAKIDLAEVMAPLRRLGGQLLPIALVLAAAALGASLALSRRLTRRLVDAEQRVASIVDVAADGIVWLDGAQRVRALNPAAEHLLAAPAAACLGRRFDTIETVVERCGIALALDQLLAAPPSLSRVWRGDLHIAAPEGVGRDLDVAVAACDLAGGRYATLILHDVSERNAHRRQLQRALFAERASLEQQRQFVATVSHEFRTPLAVIDGTAQQLMRREWPAERRRERLDQIRTTIARLTDLMESVLHVARNDLPEPTLHLSHLSLSRLVAMALAEHRPLAPASRLVLVAPPQEVWIDADNAAIRHILDNILANALKYACGTGPVHVAVTALPTLATITVIDRGIGIPAGDRDRVFDRFGRASNVGTVPGTGLGLHIARELARAHGGDITVTSEPGLGAAFTLSLPRSTPPTGTLPGLG